MKMLKVGILITEPGYFPMSEVGEDLRYKEAAFNVYRYILSNFLYEMAQGEKTEFMDTPVYKAFFKEYVKANLEYGEAKREKDLHR